MVVPLSSRPSWDDAATLRDECELRCKPCDAAKLKQCKTMGKMERFLLSRYRGGAELTNNASVGVRHCDVGIVAEDLKERSLWKASVGEAEQRRIMEARLRLEGECKGMRVLRRDKRFKAKRGLSTDIDRVMIDTLHAPTRVNEKALHLLCSKAHDNRTKAKAQPIFGVMTKKLKVMGALGDGWGPSWDEKKSDKLGSFALPHDQSSVCLTSSNCHSCSRFWT
jgi:hypothetical protein